MKMFADLKAELFKRELSNAENFDKAILAYSTGALGVSLAFLKDFIPITKAVHAWLLYGSWSLFVVSIIATTLSYVTSQLGISRQQEINEAYYLDGKEEALRERNFWAVFTEWLNFLSGLIFICGIIFTTLFVALNLERAAMAKDTKVPLQEGAPVPQVQKLPQPEVQQGAPVPPVQRLPQQPAQGSGTGSGGNSNSGGESKEGNK